MARIWTEEMVNYLKTDGLNKSYLENISDIENLFGVTLTYNQIKSCRSNRKIFGKPRGHFVKGQEPFNKGKTWDEYMPEESQKNSLETTFKKGKTPNNWRPVGSERITKDTYVEIKTKEPSVWELKHRVVWEQHNGPLKDGEIVIFKDGNTLNLDIENLAVVTRDVHARLNQNDLRFNDSELTEVGILIGKIMTKAGRRKHEKIKKLEEEVEE